MSFADSLVMRIAHRSNLHLRWVSADKAMNTKLNGGPLDLTEFVAIALSLGRNPSEVLQKAEQSALAEA